MSESERERERERGAALLSPRFLLSPSRYLVSSRWPSSLAGDLDRLVPQTRMVPIAPTADAMQETSGLACGPARASEREREREREREKARGKIRGRTRDTVWMTERLSSPPATVRRRFLRVCGFRAGLRVVEGSRGPLPRSRAEESHRRGSGTRIAERAGARTKKWAISILSVTATVLLLSRRFVFAYKPACNFRLIPIRPSPWLDNASQGEPSLEANAKRFGLSRGRHSATRMFARYSSRRVE